MVTLRISIQNKVTVESTMDVSGSPPEDGEARSDDNVTRYIYPNLEEGRVEAP